MSASLFEKVAAGHVEVPLLRKLTVNYANMAYKRTEKRVTEFSTAVKNTVWSGTHLPETRRQIPLNGDHADYNDCVHHTACSRINDNSTEWRGYFTDVSVIS